MHVHEIRSLLININNLVVTFKEDKIFDWQVYSQIWGLYGIKLNYAYYRGIGIDNLSKRGWVRQKVPRYLSFALVLQFQETQSYNLSRRDHVQPVLWLPHGAIVRGRVNLMTTSWDVRTRAANSNNVHLDYHLLHIYEHRNSTHYVLNVLDKIYLKVSARCVTLPWWGAAKNGRV